MTLDGSMAVTARYISMLHNTVALFVHWSVYLCFD